MLGRGPRAAVVVFFNDTRTTEISPLALHDALPTPTDQQHRLLVAAQRPPTGSGSAAASFGGQQPRRELHGLLGDGEDRKSTRLNSSHANISYAVFCLKKKESQALIIRTSVGEIEAM